MRYVFVFLFCSMFAHGETLLIDDFTNADSAYIGGRWSLSTDQVMGGRSTGRAYLTDVSGQSAARLEGQVSTANDGGFIQIRLVFPRLLDATAYSGVELRVIGNGAPYYVHLRDNSAWRPWHVYRAGYETDRTVQTIRLPFTEFSPYSSRISSELNVSALTSIGLVAGYDDYSAELTILSVAFY